MATSAAATAAVSRDSSAAEESNSRGACPARSTTGWVVAPGRVAASAPATARATPWVRDAGFGLPVTTAICTMSASAGEVTRGYERARHRHGVLKQIQDRAVLVHGRGQFGVALLALRAGHGDLDVNPGKARPYPIVDTEEAAEIQVAFDPHGDRVQFHTELRGPEPVRDGLAGPERRQCVLHRVRRGVGAAQRRGLVHREAVRARLDVHLGDSDQR